MIKKALLVGLVALAVASMPTRRAEACGGCFVQQSENTEVSGHRMALSVSKTQTTLWDQITYSGNPAEFAWVLPIHGQVDIGLSSDGLFSLLDSTTQVTVLSPSLSCAPPGCGAPGGFGTGAATGTSGAGGGGVTVIAQQVVGPYETVQLQSTDPQALETWLTGHGYAIPADVKPIIAAYVNEGFDFLALRLVPGQGIDSMKPIRVTSPGASPALPLRMVAAGTGATTPITLWTIGEGRYQPSNMPAFEIHADELVWDWSSQSSNYALLRKQRFDASGGKAWLLESAQPQGGWVFQQLVDVATYDPTGSGYADANGAMAVENATADVAALTAGIDPSNLWITRVSAELSRPALATDLTIGASPTQAPVSNILQVFNTTGPTPACPPQPSCGPNGANGGYPPADYVDPTAGPTGGSGCTVSAPAVDGVRAGAGLGLALVGMALVRAGRRRRDRA